MGSKGEVAAFVGPALPAAATAVLPAGRATAMRREEQEKVLRDVEGAYVAGRKQGTTGLGAL